MENDQNTIGNIVNFMLRLSFTNTKATMILAWYSRKLLNGQNSAVNTRASKMT